MGKKKKKKNKQKCQYYDGFYESDRYSDLHYHGDTQELLNKIADSYQSFLDGVDSYFIMEGERQSTYKENYKIVEDMIKKLRKGKLDPFNLDVTNEILDSGHSLISGDFEG